MAISPTHSKRGKSARSAKLSLHGKRLKASRPSGTLSCSCAHGRREARKQAPGVTLIAGGKLFGGRMTSQAQTANPLPEVRGLAFVGFPLHPAKKPSTERAAHLSDVQVPMLFLQGTRDDLADLTLLEPIVENSARARP
ncbi:alpha/beta family hydrolase [Steroidobacter cummioxidans]|uniref:alpha/beta family hydrolase n=1 Tax=Steroidobacter cummioxidans TaxID=1803913 RepID=UPI0032E38935